MLVRSVLQLAVLFLTVLVSSHPLAETSAPKTSKYTIFDSRAMTFGSDPKFFWINDNELLFVSIRTSPDTSAPAQERFTYAVSRWNIQTGAVTEVKDFGENRPDICLNDGFVLYRGTRKDGAPEAYHGKLGQSMRQVDGKQYGFFFCQLRDKTPKLPDWTEGREIRWLEKLDAGFVDFGDTQKWLENTPIRLYRHNAKQAEGIQLPFGRRDVGKRFRYYAFRSAFFVESDYYLHPRPREVPYPVYWLYTDGRIEKILEIPWGPWRSSASFFPFPARAGLVMASSNFNVRDNSDLGHAGLYLLSDGRVEKILSGWIANLEVAVSPNGCKIAFTYAPVVTRKNNVLQAIDLCEGRAK
jgi:hypothetical protein